ncbi:MAG: stage II sporulation protein R, partial [Firmicutes bacterium]|nr:stage II sporulation protein R [Bacillota bacterium]
FKTRIYENISLPAGRYESLKITIGNGDGKNWWCVVFPPMCLPAAQDRDVEISDTKVFEKSEKKIINNDNKYEIRFKIVEIFESFHEIISKIFEWTSSIFSKNSSSKSESLENIKTS